MNSFTKTGRKIMKALIDTNVLMDTIQRRQPFCDASDTVMDLIADEKIEGYVSVQSLKDVFYFCSKYKKEKDAFETVEKLSFVLNVIDMNGNDSRAVLMSGMNDYEDGLIAFSALRNGIRTIITRNVKDYNMTDMIVIDPKDIHNFIGHFVADGEVIIG